MANAGHFQPLPTNLQNRPVRTYGKMQVFSSPNRKKYLENSLKLPTSVCLTKIMLGKNNRLNLYPSLNRPRKRAQKPETSILTVAQLYHVDVHGAIVPRRRLLAVLCPSPGPRLSVTSMIVRDSLLFAWVG
jgi:hypothetical protein